MFEILTKIYYCEKIKTLTLTFVSSYIIWIKDWAIIWNVLENEHIPCWKVNQTKKLKFIQGIGYPIEHNVFHLLLYIGYLLITFSHYDKKDKYSDD